jgi:Cys-tRNA(Pro)/Cys-tRNA(Cys) deacylase
MARGTPATTALTRAGITFTECRYAHDPTSESYGLEAAAALGVEPSRVFKTLIAQTEDAASKPALVVGIVPVDRTLDLKAMARSLKVKRLSMAAVAAAERSSGYVAGGISPIGQRKPLVTVLDASALGHDTVFVSGGQRGFDIELAPNDLITMTQARVAEIAT